MIIKTYIQTDKNRNNIEMQKGKKGQAREELNPH